MPAGAFGAAGGEMATIFCLGSINLDHAYRVERLPGPGETVRAIERETSLGGKGLNATVAILGSGQRVFHVGAIGKGDSVALGLLDALSVDASRIAQVDAPTGHAIVLVDAESENQIVISPGANHCIDEEHVRFGLSDAAPGDWLVLQNEINANALGVAVARERGASIALAAAPFEADALAELIWKVDLVAMNGHEFSEFERVAGPLGECPEGTDFLITYGARGAEFRSAAQTVSVSSHRVSAVDATGAGDTFFGAFMAMLCQGRSPAESLEYANAAAALQVQRRGAAVAAPQRAEVEAFLKSRK